VGWVRTDAVPVVNLIRLAIGLRIGLLRRRIRSTTIQKNYSAEIQHPAEDHPILRLSPTAWNLRQGQVRQEAINVRFRSKADISQRHVRFTPKADIWQR
jgi:hypothetical protein